MDSIKNGWFSETDNFLPGYALSLQVEEVLYNEKSDYQDILVIKTKSHGTALILDDKVQCTELDEFAYQEMITFLPLCSHKNPARVLIVGGGDGGVAREVVKHPLVQNATQVEIDQKVIDVCKRYLPSMTKGFKSPKLELKVCDGFEYLKEHKGEFDVIITDSSDPIGPAVKLFTQNYFQLLKEALRPNGVICSQADTAWTNLDHVCSTFENCKKSFEIVRYAVTSVPTYPTGQIGFVIGTNDLSNNLVSPAVKFNPSELDSMELKYYNCDVHQAAFTLPNFIRKRLVS